MDTGQRRLTRLERAAAYALLGWAAEVCFTALQDVIGRKTRSWRLRGHSYLWMAPIYGLSAVVFEPAHAAMRGQPLARRVAAYACGITAVEYATDFRNDDDDPTLVERLRDRLIERAGSDDPLVLGKVVADHHRDAAYLRSGGNRREQNCDGERGPHLQEPWCAPWAPARLDICPARGAFRPYDSEGASARRVKRARRIAPLK